PPREGRPADAGQADGQVEAGRLRHPHIVPPASPGPRYSRPVSSAMPPAATEVRIPTDAGDLPGLLWTPSGAEGPVPGIVVLQEIFGLSAYIRGRCQDLAEQGYAVLAPQLYAR